MNDILDDYLINEFIDDQTVNRTQYIETIEKILKNNKKIRLGINGDWGSGKTVLSKMIYNLSHHKYTGVNIEYFNDNIPYIRNLKTIYFDASKEDIFDNPLLSLAKVISKELELENNFTNSKLFKGLSEILGAFAPTAALVKVIQGVKSVSESTSEFEALYNTDRIIELVKECFKKDDNYLIMIDELDRCDPKYTLRLFMTLKHFFALDNVQVIFFYNYNELWNLISHEYGYQNQNYLQKFIDFELNIVPENVEYSRKVSKSSYHFNSQVIAQIMYSLTLREINNLKFILNGTNARNDNFYVLLITHVKIKRLPLEQFNQKLIEEKIGLLEPYDSIVSSGKIREELLSRLNRMTKEEMIYFLNGIFS